MSGIVNTTNSLKGCPYKWTSGEIANSGTKGDGSAGDEVCWNGHDEICDGEGNVIHVYGTNNGK